MPDFRWTTKSQRGPLRKRVLNVISICLCLAALGLVSLAGCEVQDPSKTTAETTQVPSLSELLFRPTVPVSFATLVP
jgi:hypothetical protein